VHPSLQFTRRQFIRSANERSVSSQVRWFAHLITHFRRYSTSTHSNSSIHNWLLGRTTSDMGCITSTRLCYFIFHMSITNTTNRELSHLKPHGLAKISPGWSEVSSAEGGPHSEPTVGSRRFPKQALLGQIARQNGEIHDDIPQLFLKFRIL
jgi:hypothetical protein